MSGSRQQIRRRSASCTKVKHFTRSAARDHIEALKNRGMRGTHRLSVLKCKKCTQKEKRDVFHVGHNNGKKGVPK